MKVFQEVNSFQALDLDMDKKAAKKKKEATAASAGLESLSFPTLSGMESGLTPQSSPQFGGWLGLLDTPKIKVWLQSYY